MFSHRQTHKPNDIVIYGTVITAYHTGLHTQRTQTNNYTEKNVQHYRKYNPKLVLNIHIDVVTNTNGLPNLCSQSQLLPVGERRVGEGML